MWWLNYAVLQRIETITTLKKPTTTIDGLIRAGLPIICLTVLCHAGGTHTRIDS